MKKQAVITVVCVLMVGMLSLVGCAPSNSSKQNAGASSSQTSSVPSGDISVYSREDGSGTRGIGNPP